jgi:hypothetical protein
MSELGTLKRGAQGGDPDAQRSMVRGLRQFTRLCGGELCATVYPLSAAVSCARQFTPLSRGRARS